MQLNRRQALKAALATVASALVSKTAFAFSGFLEGTWIVRCQRGHDNMVAGLTREHVCEGGCGIKSVSEGAAWVVCPRDSRHVDWVDGITRQHKCEACGTQCRR